MTTFDITRKSGDVFTIIVDEEDFSWVSSFKWFVNESTPGYPKVWRNRTKTETKNGTGWASLLHREIYERHKGEIPEGFYVDHIDRNTLNNQKNNLRIANDSQSSTNRIPKPGTSRFKGVYLDPRGKRDRWCSNIAKRIGGKRVKKFLGTFDTEEEAAEAYDRAALEIHDSDYVVLNFPEKRDIYENR